MSLRNEAYNSIKKKMRRLIVMDKISIIIPCFNEEEALPIYYDEMKKVMDIMKKQTDFELIFVDDGSSDRTYEIMKELHRKDGRCQYLSFSRNFGKEALKDAGLQREDIDAMVTTGYGRTAISDGDKSITEITCHARGAHFLNPEVRTVIDIGGQDSKVIRLDENGAVANFVMNDKCAAGTGRFLEMMARTMEMSLDDMGKAGLSYKEDITISSMCTVFAESEVVSLIAQNKATDDIVHGLNKAVASKTAALAKRVGGEERYMMTGGVSKNQGLVKTLEEKLGTTLVISDKAQLCGALGAALFAKDMVTE